MREPPRVLIVEDDLLIADMLEEILQSKGYDVCGIARTVKEGIDLGSQHMPDLALIDFRLAEGGYGTEVGAALSAERRIGILYATGNNSQVAMQNARGDACLVKPFRTDDLIRGLEVVAGLVATGIATPPFPRGFQLLPGDPLNRLAVAGE